MTSLAIAEGWTMTGNGPSGSGNWSNWREVAAAWAVAVVLAGALLLGMPRHNAESPTDNIWSISPAAGGHTHQPSADEEGPITDQACSDRDYANERC
jgi:hypothetical protein